MRTLAKVGFHNERRFTTLKGVRFRGVLFPTNEQTLQSTTFISQRHLLRARVNEPIVARDMFTDEFGRIFLLGNDDRRLNAKTFICYEMTKLSDWHRAGVGTKDPVTKQDRPGAVEQLGKIWCSVEPMNATRDGGLNVLVDRDRIITGSLIRLGDRIDGKSVKELTTALGVSVGEIE